METQAKAWPAGQPGLWSQPREEGAAGGGGVWFGLSGGGLAAVCLGDQQSARLRCHDFPGRNQKAREIGVLK